MRVSVIVPTYKDLNALKLILDAFKLQTYKDFEVIVAEDADDVETKQFLNNFDTNLNILHFTHEDNGNRKAIILNKSLLNLESEYFIFIDGDCIPYKTFVESHVALASKKQFYVGEELT